MPHAPPAPLESILLARPFPPRRAAEALKERLTDHFRRNRPAPGSGFLNDGELVKLTGLSRSTVRRSLGSLAREGWISREVGRGNFVGARAAVAAAEREASEAGAGVATAAGPPPAPVAPVAATAPKARSARLAVMIFQVADLEHDWFTPPVLAGIESAAGPVDLDIELLGTRESDVVEMARHLERSRPDVLVCLANDPRHALLLRDAQRLEIPVVTAGTALSGIWPVSVEEDNEQAMRLAVERLLEHGHRRLGLVINRSGGSWAAERDVAFESLAERAGLGLLEAGVCRTRLEFGARHPPGVVRAEARRIGAFLRAFRPTGVVCGHYLAAQLLAHHLDDAGLRVPEDLSVVSVDQNAEVERWLHTPVDTVHLPLREIGQHIAALARAALEGAKLPETVKVPCQLVPGESVRRVGPPVGAA